MRISHRLQFGLLVRTALICSCAALLLCSCKKSPEQKILGKWNVEGDQSVVEFRKDGTYVTSLNGQSKTEKYRFTDDTHLELEGSGMQGTNKLMVRIECEVVFHDDRCDVTATLPGRTGAPSMSQTIHYVRAK